MNTPVINTQQPIYGIINHRSANPINTATQGTRIKHYLHIYYILPLPKYHKTFHLHFFYYLCKVFKTI